MENFPKHSSESWNVYTHPFPQVLVSSYWMIILNYENRFVFVNTLTVFWSTSEPKWVEAKPDNNVILVNQNSP